MSQSRNTPSDRDLERLSAYLDGELSPREHAEVDRQLALEPALRDALEGLRQTKALLRAAPRVRAPRDFTLDPARYSRPVGGGLRLTFTARVLQFSGALGAAAAVILIALGLLAPASDDAARFASEAPQAPPQTAVSFAQDEATEAQRLEAATSTATMQPSSLPPTAAALAAEASVEQPEADDAAESAAQTAPGAVSPEVFGTGAAMESAPLPQGETAIGIEGEGFAPSAGALAFDETDAGAAMPFAMEEPGDAVPLPPPAAAPGEAAEAEADAQLFDAPSPAPSATRPPATEEMLEAAAALASEATEAPAELPAAAPELKRAADEPATEDGPRWTLVALGGGLLILSGAAFVVGRRKAAGS